MAIIAETTQTKCFMGFTSIARAGEPDAGLWFSQRSVQVSGVRCQQTPKPHIKLRMSEQQTAEFRRMVSLRSVFL
jgi:hypothetical protein